jgi:hypothetical protein
MEDWECKPRARKDLFEIGNYIATGQSPSCQSCGRAIRVTFDFTSSFGQKPSKTGWRRGADADREDSRWLRRGRTGPEENEERSFAALRMTSKTPSGRLAFPGTALVLQMSDDRRVCPFQVPEGVNMVSSCEVTTFAGGKKGRV